jgi:hypothetical protein
MSILLSHVDFMPLIYGVIMYLGIYVMWYKLTHGKWISLLIDIIVFALVFKLHGGSMAGGFSAMIASLLAGITFPYMIGVRK